MCRIPIVTRDRQAEWGGPEACCRADFQHCILEIALRAKREAETEAERKERLQRSAKKEADAEDALEAMIRRSIKLHGP